MEGLKDIMMTLGPILFGLALILGVLANRHSMATRRRHEESLCARLREGERTQPWQR